MNSPRMPTLCSLGALTDEGGRTGALGKGPNDTVGLKRMTLSKLEPWPPCSS